MGVEEFFMMTRWAFVAAICVIGSSAFAQEAATTMPAVARPRIPDKTFSIADFGAVAGGKTMDGAAIHKAIAACSKAGGGTVLVPSGTYLTGPLTLTSNLNLHLEKGAVLLLSDNPDDFAVNNDKHQDEIVARDCHDVEITGEGTIDGNGATWWKAYARPTVKPATSAAATPVAPAPILAKRPYLIILTGCDRVLVQDVTIANSPSVNLATLSCQNVTIEHITIKAVDDSPNTDGINASGKNILITKSTFDTGEDDVCIKPTNEGTPDKPDCENIVVSDCTILHGKGIVIGGQTVGCLSHLRVSNCTFDGTQYGIRMRADRGRGGPVQDISYDTITMNNVKFPIYISSYFPTIPKTAAADKARPVLDSTPIWKNIRISNFTANGAMNAGSVVGLPEEPVDGVTFTNLNISAGKAMDILHAKGVVFVTSHIAVDKGKPVSVRDSEVTGVEALGGAAGGDAMP
jgi:polygalacturonase